MQKLVLLEEDKQNNKGHYAKASACVEKKVVASRILCKELCLQNDHYD